MLCDPKIPNLFVIGVPKAGTTSVLRWLGDHPQIGRSYENELRFLMDANDPLCRKDGYTTEGLAGYSRFFKDDLSQEQIKYLLDVSPQYYYQKTAQSVISDIPNSKVIFILRRPSARIYSLYNYAINNKVALDANMQFSDFVNEIRRAEKSDVLRNRPMLQYAIDHSRYETYVRHWQSIVGPERLNVYLFEDIVADPASSLCSMVRTLGLDETFYDNYDFPVQNESFVLRHRGLHKFLHRSRKKLPSWVRRSLKPTYLYINTRKPVRKISPNDRLIMSELDAEFHESEVNLAKVLGRSKPLWPRTNELSQ